MPAVLHLGLADGFGIQVLQMGKAKTLLADFKAELPAKKRHPCGVQTNLPLPPPPPFSPVGAAPPH